MKLGYVVALAVLLGLPGCSSSSSSGSGGAPAPASSFSQFPDVPIPSGATMDVDRSLVLGSGNNWVGRLAYHTTRMMWMGMNGSALYDLYKTQMPGYGWQEVTSVRSSVSVQTWQRSDRIATIQISDTTFGAEVSITVSNSNGAGSNMSQSMGGQGMNSQMVSPNMQSSMPPAASSVPMPPAVTAQPLR